MQLFSRQISRESSIILWLNTYIMILSTINIMRAVARPQQQRQGVMFEHSEPVQNNHLCRDPWQWLCDDGIECIAQYDVCDGITQCSDHSDEKHCYNRPNENFHRDTEIHSSFNNDNKNFGHFNSNPIINSTVKSMPTLTTLPPKTVPRKVTSEAKDHLQMEYIFGGLSIFVFVAFIVHVVLKRRRRFNDSVRSFRRGESLVEDEDDLLISQMYT